MTNRNDIALEDLYLFIVDTQCPNCGYLYAMLEFETESECPKCGYVEYYSDYEYSFNCDE